RLRRLPTLKIMWLRRLAVLPGEKPGHRKGFARKGLGRRHRFRADTWERLQRRTNANARARRRKCGRAGRLQRIAVKSSARWPEAARAGLRLGPPLKVERKRTV